MRQLPEDQLNFDFVIQLDAQIKRDKELSIIQKERESQRKSWKMCWDWDGPKVGEPLEVSSTCVRVLGEEGKSYWYCAPCIAEKEIEPDIWIARLEYSDEAPKHCRDLNGTKLLLDVADIWPPVRILSARWDS